MQRNTGGLANIINHKGKSSIGVKYKVASLAYITLMWTEISYYEQCTVWSR